MIIKPPQNPAKYFYLGPTIFLAGSIEMGVAENWQEKVSEPLSNKGYIIFNPRRDDWDSSWEQDFSNPYFYQQVNWELDTLEKANHIIMYFSPETKSPISLLELGLFATSGKLLVCCPKGFWRRGNVDIVCNKYYVPLFDSLEEIINYLPTIKK